MNEHIDVLKNMINNKDLNRNEIIAIIKAISALGKQNQIQLIKRSGFYERKVYTLHGHDHTSAILNAQPYNYNEIYFICPICGNTFGWRHESKYCDQCGQEIDRGENID